MNTLVTRWISAFWVRLLVADVTWAEKTNTFPLTSSIAVALWWVGGKVKTSQKRFCFILTAHTVQIKPSTTAHLSFYFPETQASVLSASVIALRGINRECSYWKVVKDENSFVLIQPKPPSYHPPLYLSCLPIEQLVHLYFSWDFCCMPLLVLKQFV